MAGIVCVILMNSYYPTQLFFPLADIQWKRPFQNRNHNNICSFGCFWKMCKVSYRFPIESMPRRHHVGGVDAFLRLLKAEGKVG